MELPRLLKRGNSEELDADRVNALRKIAGAPEPTPRLTLAPVIGQRRAVPTEFRPDSPRAWTGGSNEASDVAQFDKMRDDGWRTPGAKRAKPARRPPGSGPGKARGPNAPRGAGAGFKNKGRGPNPRGERNTNNPAFAPEPGINPAVLKSWFGDNVGKPRRSRPGHDGGSPVGLYTGVPGADQGPPKRGNPNRGTYGQQPGKAPVNDNIGNRGSRFDNEQSSGPDRDGNRGSRDEQPRGNPAREDGNRGAPSSPWSNAQPRGNRGTHPGNDNRPPREGNRPGGSRGPNDANRNKRPGGPRGPRGGSGGGSAGGNRS